MSFQKFKSDSFLVGGRHRSATKKDIYGDITIKGSTVPIGYCSISKRKKSLTVSDMTFQTKSLSDSFKNLGKNGVAVPKKVAKNPLQNPGRAL